jgi:hypothetical protein
MTLVLLLAALAVSGVGIWMSRRWRVLGQIMMGLGGVGLIAVLAVQVRQNLFSPQPKASNRCNMAVSYCLASCVLEDLASQSGNVVLLFPQRRLMDADTEQSYEEGFALPLRHNRGKLHLKAVRLEGGDRDPAHGLSALKQALAQQAPEALAIVSYAGAPAGFETLFSAEQPKIGPFYVFDPDGTTNWLGALKAGRIKAVVLPRPGVDSRGQEAITGMPQAVFERFYLLATPETADQVAAQLTKR